MGYNIKDLENKQIYIFDNSINKLVGLVHTKSNEPLLLKEFANDYYKKEIELNEYYESELLQEWVFEVESLKEEIKRLEKAKIFVENQIKNLNCKLNKDDVLEIKQLKDKGLSNIKIAKIFNVSEGTIRNYLKNNN